MKTRDVKIGDLYTAKVSDRLVTVRIDAVSPHGGWVATNTATGKRIRIKSPQRLRGPARGETTTEPAASTAGRKPHDAGGGRAAATDRPRKVGALTAAAQVLQAAGRPMRVQELIEAMTGQGLWSSPNGKTPAATLYAAIVREIHSKGQASRFRKTDRGRFEYHAKKGE